MYRYVTSITIDSKHLDTALRSALLSTVKQREGTCYTTIGCLQKVYSVDAIHSASVVDGENVFVIECTIESFLPQLNVPYPAKVIAVYPEGTAIVVNNCDRVTAMILDVQLKVETTQVVLNEIRFKPSGYHCVASIFVN